VKKKRPNLMGILYLGATVARVKEPGFGKIEEKMR